MARVDTAYPLLRERHRRDNLAALGVICTDMADDIAARYDAGARVLLAKRWDAALTEVMLTRNTATATEVALRVAAALGSDYDPDIMAAWLGLNAEIGASLINEHTRTDLAAAEDRDQVEHVLTVLTTSRVAMFAESMVTSIAGFAARDAAEKSGAAVKIWRTNSTRPRSAHRRMNNESVPVGERFSNGMDWPGDYEGGADEVANCRCSLTILT